MNLKKARSKPLDKSMNIARAREIPGWMIDSELEWLADQAGKHSRIVEVGCWVGRSTRALADNTIGLVYAVDTFEGSEEHQKFLKDKPTGWILKRFLENLHGCSNVHPVISTSLEAADNLAINAQQFDMIFIDANHDYAHVREDILAWMPLLLPGGLLCGHDYGPNWPEVAKAVDELIPDVQIGANQIWFRPST
jgi:predicted O-methyltransferase YrrM